MLPAILIPNVLRGITEIEIMSKIKEIRKNLGDPPILRALHFIKENERVDYQVSYLRSGDFMGFLKLFRESGDSSFKWLQNIYSPAYPKEQPISLALAITERFLHNLNITGAARIQGGGFAGTILVLIPQEFTQKYSMQMESVFHSGCVKVLKIRNTGCCRGL